LQPILTSHRWRRRLAWIGGALLLGAGIAIAAVALPRSSGRHYLAPTGTQAPVTVAQQKSVPVTKSARRGIDATLAAFVRTGVTRADPAAAWNLVTPAMRAGISRKDWNNGELPVSPLDARDDDLGWNLLSSYPGDVTVDVVIHPRKRTKEGAIAYAVEFKRTRGGRWLIDSMVPEHIFGAEPAPTKKPLPPLPPGFKPKAPRGALGPIWFIVPGVLLGLAILVPIGFAIRTWLRHRAIEKRYRSGRL
jgi:hypothetical protein